MNTDENIPLICDPENYPEDLDYSELNEMEIKQPVLDDFIINNHFNKSFESFWERPICYIIQKLDFSNRDITELFTKVKLSLLLSKLLRNTIKEIKINEKKRKKNEKVKIRSVIRNHILLFNDKRENSLMALNNRGERIRTEHRFASRNYTDKYLGKA